MMMHGLTNIKFIWEYVLNGKRDVYKIFVGECFGKQTLGRMIRRWRNNIKICLREIILEV
jgi:hypothetical protein